MRDGIHSENSADDTHTPDHLKVSEEDVCVCCLLLFFFFHFCFILEILDVCQSGNLPCLGRQLPPGEDLGEFGPNKNDPKYQTLPYNTKFSVTFKTKSAQGGDSDSAPSTPTGTAPPSALPDLTASSAQNNGTTAAATTSAGGAPVNGSVVTRTVHSIPTHPPSRGHAHAPALSQGPPLAPPPAALKPAPNPAMTPR